jgi:hypothetical protein
MERKIGFTALKDVPRTNGEQLWRAGAGIRGEGGRRIAKIVWRQRKNTAQLGGLCIGSKKRRARTRHLINSGAIARLQTFLDGLRSPAEALLVEAEGDEN